MRLSGMPVHLETTCKMSSSSTLTRFSSRVVRQSFRTDSSFSLACFSLSRIGGRAFEILVLDGAFLLAS